VSLNRRSFLTATASAPWVVSASALGLGRRHSANNRITIGMIGCGKMAKDYHIPQLLTQPDAQLVAV